MKRVFFIFLLLATLPAWSQNLVPNASFEQVEDCPQNATRQTLSALQGWNQPGEGTPDIFNDCSERLCRPKRNFAGTQLPREGKGYAGFIAFSNEVKTYREYLQAPLKNNLAAGKTYEVVLHVSLADHSGYAVSNVGCGFNNGPLESLTNFALSPMVILECDTLVKDTLHWVKLVFQYTAKGNENYFLLGNFRKYHEIKKIAQVKPGKGGVNNVDAYYYVDQVSVTERGNAATVLNSNEKTVQEYFTNDSTLVLNNLEFDYDSYQLSEKDAVLLEKIAGYFKTHPQYCLTVEGHTDANGSYAYNNELSKKRAEEVGRYLENKGIEGSRLTPVGLGFTQPIDRDMKSARNRRVEIKLKTCK